MTYFVVCYAIPTVRFFFGTDFKIVSEVCYLNSYNR